MTPAQGTPSPRVVGSSPLVGVRRVVRSLRRGRHLWVVLMEMENLRWGGDLRRAHLLRPLAQRVEAHAYPGWRGNGLRLALTRARGRRSWRGRPMVASAELLEPAALELVRTMARPVALDFHDDPVAQLGALGFPSDDEAALRRRVAANLDLFERIIVMSETFREHAGLAAERCILAPNGTDTTHIRPLPMPDRPVVGHASGAAPGRGLEQLIAAARIARATIPDIELRLWLVATGEASEAYLRGLMADVAGDPWIRIETAPYASIGEHLGQAMVLCVPLPTHPYLHGVLPIKLFDSMAAGRPIVATPCFETAKLLRARDAGLVTEDDTPEAIAAGLLAALADGERAARWAANARAAAVSEFDWRVIGERVADDIARHLGRSR